MKKIITLFLLISSITFAIPDFDSLRWGFSINAIKGFYPNLNKTFTTGEGVTKYNYLPKYNDFRKVSFYLFDDKLYKIVAEFDSSKISSNDVSKIFNKYEKEFGKAKQFSINETYDDFSIKGNKQTWTLNSTYISFIGKDYFDKDNNLNDSKLLMEYGLIDPSNRDQGSLLNNLILNKD